MKTYTVIKTALVSFIFLFITVAAVYPQNNVPNQINYESKVFISDDYVFNKNEYLYKPWKIRINKQTKEIFISDVGNFCMYVFDYQGKFIRKFGSKGQGPGELLNLWDFYLDKDGTVYITDLVNNRITIYSREGKYIGELKKQNLILNHPFSSIINLFIYNDELILNMSNREYYFSVFNKKGELIKSIGEIDKFRTDYSRFNMAYAEGIPIVDNYGNYYIFLSSRFMIRKYDKDGKHVMDVYLDKYNPDLKDFIKERLPEKQSGIITNNLLGCVVYDNDRFYFSFWEPPYKRPRYEVTIFELNDKLELITKHKLNFKYDLTVVRRDISDDTLKFDILYENQKICFIFPLVQYSVVVKFIK